jgi:hypothetical protein
MDEAGMSTGAAPDRQPTRLAEQQAALVAALVAAGPDPPGFDAARLDAVRRALLVKRASEVAAAWPRLAAAFGAQWTSRFAGWASGRPPAGALRDGFDFARALAQSGGLPALAADELADMDARWRYPGTGSQAPCPRRFPLLYRLARRHTFRASRPR